MFTRTITIAALFGLNPLALAGNETRGGGDIVICQRSLDNELEGTYSLDYVLTYQYDNQNPTNQLVPVTTWQESRDRIDALLSQKLPTLHRQFANFLDHMDNFSDYSRDRIWRESPFKLIDISDEDFLVVLPDNCFEPEGDKINIIQAVIYSRDTDTNFISYLFDPQIYDELHDTRPLQFSFLMVHEWLWDFFSAQSLNRMRDTIRLLHSKQLEDLSPQRLWRSLRNLGIPPAALGPEPGPQIGPTDGMRIALSYKRSCLLRGGKVTCWDSGGTETYDNDSLTDFASSHAREFHVGINHQRQLVKMTPYTYSLPHDPIRNPLNIIARNGSEQRNSEMCILTEFDGVRCWYPTSFQPETTRLDLLNPTSVRIGENFYCGTTSVGLKCVHEGLGDSDRLTRVINEWGRSITELTDYSLGDDYACFIDNGKLTCFQGRDGDLDTSVPSFTEAKVVRVGSDHGCAIGDGLIKCWSWHGDADERARLTTLPYIGRYPTYLDASATHTCAIDEIGVSCWGMSGDHLDVPQAFYPFE